MSNIISAIINLVSSPKTELFREADSHNRVNNMGVVLEEYVKDLFAGTVAEKDPIVRNAVLSSTFSYFGNQNNPPDCILFGGDAIEVKKIENKDSALALNSSYPKAKLYAASSMISKACRDCEHWTEKDVMYAVGVVKGNKLTSLAFVYGEDYCADKETYQNIKYTIKTGVETIPNIEFADTKELGRINHIDPLGITYLRVRGMWGIENPFSVFNYIYKRNFSNLFNFMCVINNDKFNSFKNKTDLFELAKKNNNLSISDVRIKDPISPAHFKEAKLITFFVGAEK